MHFRHTDRGGSVDSGQSQSPGNEDVPVCNNCWAQGASAGLLATQGPTPLSLGAMAIVGNPTDLDNGCPAAHPEGEDAKLVTVENPKGQWGEGRARTPNGHQTGPRYPRRPGHVGHHPNISGRWWEQCFPALNQKGSGPLLKGQSEHLILKGGERGLFAR